MFNLSLLTIEDNQHVLCTMSGEILRSSWMCDDVAASKVIDWLNENQPLIEYQRACVVLSRLTVFYFGDGLMAVESLLFFAGASIMHHAQTHH